MRCLQRRVGHVLARRCTTVPAVALRSPARHCGQLALAVAGDAGQAHDLAGVDLQVDAAQRLGAAIAHARAGPAICRRTGPALQRLRRQRLDLAPDHHVEPARRGSTLAGRARADHPPIAQRRSPGR